MFETFRRSALGLQSLFNDFDRAAEGTDTACLDGDDAPVFIVGAPRTGSTLLYQILLQQLEVSYICNLMAALPRHMVKVCRLWPGFASRYTAPVKPSHHGFIAGLRAPSEAGKVVDRWFRDATWEADRPRIRAQVAGITRATGAPLLLKSLTLSTQLDRLRATFPGCRLIVVRRDPRFAAQSVLESRRRMGDETAWWSVAPPGWEAQTGRPPAEQAAWQVMETDRLVADSLQRLGGPWLAVAYADLCAAPETVVAKVEAAFGLPRRRPAPPLPAGFDPREAVRLPEADWRRIEDTCAALRDA